jgi:hypothetical protein
MYVVARISLHFVVWPLWNGSCSLVRKQRLVLVASNHKMTEGIPYQFVVNTPWYLFFPVECWVPFSCVSRALTNAYSGFLGAPHVAFWIWFQRMQLPGELLAGRLDMDGHGCAGNRWGDWARLEFQEPSEPQWMILDG